VKRAPDPASPLPRICLHLLARVAVLAALTGALTTPLAGQVSARTSAEIDAFWNESERTVREGDFQAYAALYHPDAVLVRAGSGDSVPIGTALAGWREGFEQTARGEVAAELEIRIGTRLASASTSHETGIFRYESRPAGGAPTVALVHFEALVVKVDGSWLWMMEFQKGPATEAEWEALAGAELP
jgi:ketosteroid isomerase-like protein